MRFFDFLKFVHSFCENFFRVDTWGGFVLLWEPLTLEIWIKSERGHPDNANPAMPFITIKLISSSRILNLHIGYEFIIPIDILILYYMINVYLSLTMYPDV